jgi:hypothetical protein
LSLSIDTPKYAARPKRLNDKPRVRFGNNLGDDHEFTASYESLSGRKYFAELQLQVREPRIVVPKDDLVFKEAT